MKNYAKLIGAVVVGFIVSLFVTEATIIETVYKGTMAACNFIN